VEGENMTREAKIMAGIILITVPSIRYGGYFLLTQLMDRSSGYMDNPLRRNFSRAGHAHVGVIVILSLVCQVLAYAGHAAGADYVAGASGRAAGCDPDSPGLFPVGDVADGELGGRGGGVDLRWGRGAGSVGGDAGGSGC
jgi:hypothetical protein